MAIIVYQPGFTFDDQLREYYVVESAGTVTGLRTPSNAVFSGGYSEVISWESGSAILNAQTLSQTQTLVYAGNDLTPKPFTVTIAADNQVEGDEYFYQVIRRNGVEVERNRVNILDDDISRVTVRVSTDPVVEGRTPSVTFTISLSNPVAHPTTVTYRIIGDTALNGTDFIGTEGSVTFAASTTTPSPKTVTIPIVNDLISEATESFRFEIVDFSDDFGSESSIPQDRLLIGTPSIVIVSISDDDGPIGFTAPTPPAQLEGQTGFTPYTFTLVRGGDLTAGASVEWYIDFARSTANADDFQQTQGVVQFDPLLAPGATETSVRTFTVFVRGDVTPEPDETFTVVLRNPVGSKVDPNASTATATIRNDDPLLVFSAGQGPQTEGDAGTRPFDFKVTRTGDLSQAVSATWEVDFASSTASADDFAVSRGVLKFDPGQGEGVFTVQVNGDLVPELDETFRVKLTTSNGAVIAGDEFTATIVNDDAAGTIVIPITQFLALPEGDGGVTIFNYTLLRLDGGQGALDIPYTITYAGASPDDFGTPPASIHFDAGNPLATLSLPVLTNAVGEGHEGFSILIGGGQVPQFQLVGVIVNDDLG